MKHTICIHTSLGYAFAFTNGNNYVTVHQRGIFSPPHIGCGFQRPHLMLPKQSIGCYSGSLNHYSYSSSSSQLYNNYPVVPKQHKIYGPVIHRSQSPTHLDDVEDAINSSLLHYQQLIQSSSSSSSSSSSQKLQLDTFENILQFPPRDREAIGVASNLQRRLQGLANSGDCRRCWLQKFHCVCETCVPLEDEDDGVVHDADADEDADGGGLMNVNRLFLLTHHKEICLAVDTAKLILASFPSTSQLVVSGIGREFQPAMGEMLDAVSSAAANNNKCLILFPTEDAKTFDEIKEDVMLATNMRRDENLKTKACTANINTDGDIDRGWDVIVIDGTWSQARKMHAKHFPQPSTGCLYRVQLSDEAVKVLDVNSGNSGDESSIGDDDNNNASGGSGVTKGYQLRRHPIKWREISTLEATRLLLNDMHVNGEFEKQSKAMAYYQEVGNNAARRQLGPPRVVE